MGKVTPVRGGELFLWCEGGVTLVGKATPERDFKPIGVFHPTQGVHLIVERVNSAPILIFQAKAFGAYFRNSVGKRVL